MPGIYQPGSGPNGIVETPINTQAGAFNVYMGERYVPLLADPIEWNNQLQYEPLTIVTYQGNSYTSRQYVPVGVDITNNTYWALTGNFNGQISSIQNQISLINNSLDDLNNDIDKLFNITNNIPLPRKIAVLSDSYGVGASGINPWPNLLSDIIPTFSVVNISLDGIGFTRTEPEKSPLNRLKNVITTMGDLSSYTDFLIAMGANDLYNLNYSSALNNITEFTSYVRNNFPNAKIWLAFIGNNGSLISRDYYDIRMGLINTYKQAAGYNNLCYIDNIYNIMQNLQNANSDLIHPNTNGNSLIAKAFSIALNNVEYIYNFTASSNITPISVTGGEGAVMRVYCYNQQCRAEFNLGEIQQFTTVGATWTDFYTINNPSLIDNGFAIAITDFYVSDTNNNFHEFKLRIQNGKIQYYTNESFDFKIASYGSQSSYYFPLSYCN